ncbi:hypothetical protein KL933_005407, partial [Ogataea haglerorum]
CRAGAPPAR